MEKGKNAVIHVLLVIVDQRMIMTLGALKIDAEKEAADIARQGMRFAVSIDEKPRRGTCFRIGAIRREDLARQLIPRFVRGNRLAQELTPGFGQVSLCRSS